VACYTNTKIPFISFEKNGPDPLPIAGSSSRRRPCSPAKTVGSRPFPDRTAGSRQAGQDPAVPRPDGRDLAVPRTEWPDPSRQDGIWPGTAGMDVIRPFPEQNGRIPPGWMESDRSRPERPDPGRPAGMAGIWPFPDQTGRIPAYLVGDKVVEVSGREFLAVCCVSGVVYSPIDGMGIVVFMY
jgi:hypothetical protein